MHDWFYHKRCLAACASSDILCHQVRSRLFQLTWDLLVHLSQLETNLTSSMRPSSKKDFYYKTDCCILRAFIIGFCNITAIVNYMFIWQFLPHSLCLLKFNIHIKSMWSEIEKSTHFSRYLCPLKFSINIESKNYEPHATTLCWFEEMQELQITQIEWSVNNTHGLWFNKVQFGPNERYTLWAKGTDH